MNRTFTLMVSLVFAFGIRAFGQAPSVHPALDRASYTVKFIWKNGATAAASPGNALPSEVAVQRFDGIQNSKITWLDGKQTEDWADGPLLVTRSPVGDWLNVMNIQSEEASSAWRALTLSAFGSWATGDAFKEENTIQERRVFRFERKSPSDDSNETLWIDAVSLLPVAYENSDLKGVFTFWNAPSSPLSPPQEYVKKLSRFRELDATPVRLSGGK
ncbi:hypothetical protein [Terrimicrobium sacchariphilum]|nr:hypothetical protein [Terrimicrobium sacchariphilum]